MLVLWAAVGAIAALAFLAGVFFFWRGWRWIGGILALIGAISALGAAAFIGLWIWVQVVPQNASGPEPFRAEFHIEPAGVTNIRAQLTQTTDAQRRVMRFHAPPAMIARITQTKFKTVSLADCDAFRRFEGAPEWWKPHGTKCAVANPYDDAFASNQAWLLYDEASQDAHYAYEGVD